MPDIDVSDVLSDPGFMDTFQVVTSTLVINSAGIPVITPAAPVDATGVVEPDRQSLRRMDDGSRLAASIQIWTQFPLKAGLKTDDTNSAPADIVTWQGRQYTVAAIEQWTDYGQGYIRAAADLLLMNPTT